MADPTLPLPSWLAPTLFGVLFHVSTQPLEPDMFLLPLSGALALVGAVHVYLSTCGMLGSPASSLPAALANLAQTTALFAAGLTASMLVYRGLLHRLRWFPGPVAARLSKLYGVWVSVRGGVRWHLELERLHGVYGDVVRVGPRELSIIRPEALPYLAACRKSVFYHLADWNNDRLGLIETRDIEDHRRRRRPWESALNNKSLAKYDPLMQPTITHLLTAFSAASAAGKPVNVTEWMAWMAYDLMGIVGFGRDFGQLAGGGVEHWAVRALKAQQMFFGVLKPVPWLMNAAANIPGADASVRPFVNYCKGLVAEKKATRAASKTATSTQPTDILSWLLQSIETASPHRPRTPAALDEDARTIVVAGSDTTSNTLTNTFYHLAHAPHHYRTLQHHLDALFPAGAPTFTYARLLRPDAAAAAALAHLDAILNETLRLKPATPSGNPRTTPPEGLRIPLRGGQPLRMPGAKEDGAEEELWIPGDTDVFVPPWCLHRDGRWFGGEEAGAFRPERWLDEGGVECDRSAFFPFQVGQYACVGKALAMWEMRSVLARVALGFDLEWPDEGDRGRAFEEGIQDTFTMTLRPLWMVFKERAGA